MQPGWLRRTGDRDRVREGGGSFLASTSTVAGTETGGLAGSPGSGGCRLRPPSPSLPRVPTTTPARPPTTPARSRCRSSDAGARGSHRRAGTGAGSAAAAPLRGGEASAHLRGGSGLSPPFPPRGRARGWGGLRLNPLSRCAPTDGVPGTPGRRDGPPQEGCEARHGGLSEGQSHIAWKDIGDPRGKGCPLGMLSTGVHGRMARWMVGWLAGHWALQKGCARFPEGMSLWLGSRWLAFPVGKACGTLGLPQGTHRSPGGTCRLGSSW